MIVLKDLQTENDVPPVPLKTYQWEDIRRQKLEGGYPWTHLYKRPFDNEDWEKAREHEYEPVVPMDTRNAQPPFIKIIAENESTPTPDSEMNETIQDKHHLRVPNKNEYEDSENDDDDDHEDDDEDNSEDDEVSIEITAEELQNRIEERYFHNSAGSSKSESYEITEKRSLSSPTSDDERSRSRSNTNVGLQHRMRQQTEKIKRKLKDFKEQLAKETLQCTPKMKRKNDVCAVHQNQKPTKKNKFNFRRRNPTPDRSKSQLSVVPDFHLPSAPRLSLPRLPSFSRSRSSSVKEDKRKHSESSETNSKKKFDFHFGTYPRIFNRKKKLETEKKKLSHKSTAKSEPSSPISRRSPFPQSWLSRLTEYHKKEDTIIEGRKEDKTEIGSKENTSTSMHEDSKMVFKDVDTLLNKSIIESTPTKMKIDNEKFIFISLHEERFPEKLIQKEKQEQVRQQEEQEQQIEKEIKTDTVRKFHSILRQLRTDRKAKGKWKTTTAADDDKPQPVEITEIIGDDSEDQIKDTVFSNVEAPEDEELVKSVAEDVPPENYSFENKKETTTPDSDAGNSYEQTPKLDTSKEKVGNIPSRATPREVFIETELVPPVENDTVITEKLTVPQKLPRNRLKKLGSDKESKESLSAFKDSVFIDAVQLDEQEPMSKTYIKGHLEQVLVNDRSGELENTTHHFKEYEEALRNSRNFSSVETENNFYSRQNSLARLEVPVPPARPSRMYSLARKKKVEPSQTETDKENYYDLNTNSNYNTFPIMKPNRPRRKFRKRRTYSNSTTNTDTKSVNDIEDDAINKNIVNSKQLSVSFLPLTSNIVGEPITDYTIRETSSMIHLNLSDPPLPPKRKKEKHDCSNSKYTSNSLQNQTYVSKTSLTLSEVYNDSGLNANDEIDYADDVNSTILDSDSSPKRPRRRRNTSFIDEDRTSREVESLPSSSATKDETAFYDSDSKDGSGYAVIGASESRRESKAEFQSSQSTTRRKSRRISDFFTLPRIRPPTNYVPPVSLTLDHRRLPSPSRPPRRNRPNCKPIYTNENGIRADSSTGLNYEEEELNFNLATLDDDAQEQDDFKNLQTDDILERMKSRPLPPPPKPLRKPKDDSKNDYSQCNKNKININENNLNQNFNEKIINTVEVQGTLRSNWFSGDISTVMQEFTRTTRELNFENFTENGFNQRSHSSMEQYGKCTLPGKKKLQTATRQISPFNNEESKNESPNECSNSNTRSELNNETFKRAFFNTNAFTQTGQSTEICPNENRNDVKERLNIINACKLNVSELNVGRLNINEIESSKLITSTVESSNLQVSDIPTVTDQLVFNSIDCADCLSSPEQCCILDTVKLENQISSTEETEAPSERSRLSSMIPEIGSDEESGSTVTKAVRPARRKHSVKSDEAVSQPKSDENNRPSLGELMSQILQICHSSVGQAIHSLLEQVIPEDREKRNEVQAAIWVMTIIIAGCLMLGLQTNEKIVHHHHWDFHFPPPH